MNANLFEIFPVDALEDERRRKFRKISGVLGHEIINEFGEIGNITFVNLGPSVPRDVINLIGCSGDRSDGLALRSDLGAPNEEERLGASEVNGLGHVLDSAFGIFHFGGALQFLLFSLNAFGNNVLPMVFVGEHLESSDRTVRRGWIVSVEKFKELTVGLRISSFVAEDGGGAEDEIGADVLVMRGGGAVRKRFGPCEHGMASPALREQSPRLSVGGEPIISVVSGGEIYR